MVKKILLIIAVLLFGSCDTSLQYLTMFKTPYTGDDLRIDGYYYSSPINENYIRVAVFYRDGFCFHTSINPKNQDTLNCIENEILLNDAFISKLKNAPAHIGVFRIGNSLIEFEAWEYRSWTYTYFGKIINDTTFIINKRVYRSSSKSNITYDENTTYRFRQFSPKPDSTNVFIK